MNKHKNTSTKIILALIVSFILTKLAVANIFLANTPVINKASIADKVNSTKYFFASLFTKSSNQDFASIEKLPTSALKSLATGVYAKEDAQGDVVYIRVTKDMQWEEKVITYNGKQITIRVPKGTFK